MWNTPPCNECPGKYNYKKSISTHTLNAELNNNPNAVIAQNPKTNEDGPEMGED